MYSNAVGTINFSKFSNVGDTATIGNQGDFSKNNRLNQNLHVIPQEWFEVLEKKE